MLHPLVSVDFSFDILNLPVHDTHPALLINIPHPYEPTKRSIDLSRVEAMAERRVMRHNRIIGLFAKVYGTARVVVEIMNAYGVEVCQFVNSRSFIGYESIADGYTPAPTIDGRCT